jgi:hypothetical protein
MIDYKEFLKDHDSNTFMLETNERPITNQSAVCISPYNTETGMWIAGMNIIIPMAEVLSERLPIVTDPDDIELKTFLDTYYPKEK